MIYLFVITTFVFLALWLNARHWAKFYKHMAIEAVDAGKLLVEANDEQKARLQEIAVISERMKGRLQR